jgi:hypothetical protein
MKRQPRRRVHNNHGPSNGRESVRLLRACLQCGVAGVLGVEGHFLLPSGGGAGGCHRMLFDQWVPFCSRASEDGVHNQQIERRVLLLLTWTRVYLDPIWQP